MKNTKYARRCCVVLLCPRAIRVRPAARHPSVRGGAVPCLAGRHKYRLCVARFARKKQIYVVPLVARADKDRVSDAAVRRRRPSNARYYMLFRRFVVFNKTQRIFLPFPSPHGGFWFSSVFVCFFSHPFIVYHLSSTARDGKNGILVE